MFYRIAKRFRSASHLLFYAQIAMVIVVITNAVSLVTLQPIVDRIFVSEIDPLSFDIPFFDIALNISKMQLLIYLTGFFLAARLVYAVSLYLQRYMMMSAGEIMVNTLRTDLYAKLLSLSMPFYSKKHSGELVANLTADLGVVQHLASTIAGDLIRRPFEITFLISLLFWYDQTLAFYSIGVAPFIIGIVRFISKSVRGRAAKMQSTMADLSGILQESVSGIRIIQAFTAEERMIQKFKDSAVKYLRRSKRVYAMMAAATPSTELVTASAIGGIILYGGNNVINKTMTPGEFFAFMAILMSTYQPVKTLVNALAEAGRANAALDRIFSILDTELDIKNRDDISKDEIKPAHFFESITFSHLGFSYMDTMEKPILEEINFTVKKGETIAIVGPSGAGKTTLLSLIPRFYDPTKGSIQLDGVDLRDIDLTQLRKLTGIVTQETFLFNDTIASNISFGKPEATMEQIIEAARSANILDTIEAMPDGLQTIVGERGARLSGGEKQRIAIARALLADPPILILDEATSSLDSESEKRVQNAIDNLIEGRTTLVIAHRLSTVQHADKIIVLEYGQIIESGRHKELLGQEGLYSKLHKIQFRQA